MKNTIMRTMQARVNHRRTWNNSRHHRSRQITSSLKYLVNSSSSPHLQQHHRRPPITTKYHSQSPEGAWDLVTSVTPAATITSFERPFFSTTWVSRHQEVNHSGFYWSKRWWGGSGSSWTICKSFAPCSSTSLLRFLQARCPLCHPPNSIKAQKANRYFCKFWEIPEFGRNIMTQWQICYNEALDR